MGPYSIQIFFFSLRNNTQEVESKIKKKILCLTWCYTLCIVLKTRLAQSVQLEIGLKIGLGKNKKPIKNRKKSRSSPFFSFLWQFRFLKPWLYVLNEGVALKSFYFQYICNWQRRNVNVGRLSWKHKRLWN